MSVPLWINLTAPLGMLALAGPAAAVPAVRAGRLRAVAAISAGQAPRAGRGAVLYRLATRLGLPETVTAGLAAPFSRPARSAVTLAALLFGLTGVVLGTSLNSSIHKINHSAIHGLGQLQTAFHGSSSAFTPQPGRDRPGRDTRPAGNTARRRRDRPAILPRPGRPRIARIQGKRRCGRACR